MKIQMTIADVLLYCEVWLWIRWIRWIRVMSWLPLRTMNDISAWFGLRSAGWDIHRIPFFGMGRHIPFKAGW